MSCVCAKKRGSVCLVCVSVHGGFVALVYVRYKSDHSQGTHTHSRMHKVDYAVASYIMCLVAFGCEVYAILRTHMRAVHVRVVVCLE